VGKYIKKIKNNVIKYKIMLYYKMEPGGLQSILIFDTVNFIKLINVKCNYFKYNKCENKY